MLKYLKKELRDTFMKMPQGYDMSKYSQMGCPKEWLDYFMSNEPEEEEKNKTKNKTMRKVEHGLDDVTEEQIENPNFWINL